MANTYRDDKDLELLQYADNEMLEILVTYLTKDENGETRITQELLDSEDFKNANGNYQKVWKEIAAELQYFGGDTVVNFFRGSGVTYKEILIDVCKKIKVKTNYSRETIKIEQDLLAKLFEKAWSKMSQKERDEVKSKLGVDPSLTGSILLASILASISAGIISRDISLLLARSLAQVLIESGLFTVAEVGATRLLGVFTGPIGWTIVGLLTVPAISGPAFRVTLPCTIQIAAIRQQMLNKDYF